MASNNEHLDPEPVDAEFEPADVETPGKAARSGSVTLITGFVAATLIGGTLGAWGSQFFAPEQVSDEGGAAAERAALTQHLTGLETRLTAIEAEDPARVAQATVGEALLDLESRIAALESLPPGSTDLTPLETRIAALETAPAPAAGEGFDAAPLDARIGALESDLDGLESTASSALEAAQQASASAIDPSILQNLTERVAALENSSDQAATPVVDNGAQVAALEARIAALETALLEARSVADAAQSAADSAQTTADDAARTAATSSQSNSEADRQLAARVLALTALRDMAATGTPFEAERAALARLWRGQPDLAALAGYSRAGVPDLDTLNDEFPAAAIREAAGPGRIFFGLIEVRDVSGGSDSDNPLALTALAETRLGERDLTAAVGLTEQLEGDALAAAQDWLIAARARLAVDAAITRLRQALAEDAAELGADPS
ncbi:hypothetical protein [Maricaulis sp.]|uniref:COG4223 family protein n=1 Tax=Maricaulis sp. TaxID=1486257 RepID=UPI002627A074|nr:hypothetical protein [Maricaulis sp.]